MDSIHDENEVWHPCFLMKKQAEHQCKDSLNSHSLKHCDFGVRYYLLPNSPAVQNKFEKAGDCAVSR